MKKTALPFAAVIHVVCLSIRLKKTSGKSCFDLFIGVMTFKNAMQLYYRCVTIDLAGQTISYVETRSLEAFSF